MSEAHKPVGAIFDAAIDLPPEQRAAYVQEACASDVALRQRVEALIRAHDAAESFMDRPAAVPVPKTIVLTLPPTEQPGDWIGRYKLLQQIGEGGCGVVYMAEQEQPVKRRVALKVIKLGMDTKSVIARFEAERQALALMDHPNIAKVLDAGATDKGRPYFVMELVRGIRITDYCDQNNLSTQARLDLFAQVCRAIQHAHQKGIIHRDIKPSNILVTMNDGVPVPKVIDFGIAKATQGKLTDQTLFTAFEQFIGTPAYMSPEQAEMTALDIDTRSDLYSLGVLLYELLTGKTPFDAKELMQAGLDEMRRQIREKEPARPSTRLSTMLAADLTAVAAHRQSAAPKLIHMVRGDLDWIVMKCLEKDRTRRYETANGLAADLKRHLENEPVLARPPSKMYRFQKMARRNKAAFATTALVAIVLVAAAGVSAWQAVRATRAETLAKQRLAESEANAALAKERRAESEAISKFLIELFQSPDPARDGRTITVAEILGTAAKNLETDLASQLPRRAKLQSTLGLTYFGLGLYHEAIPLQEKVRDFYLSASGPEDIDTLKAKSDLANSYVEIGRAEEAQKIEEEVLAIRRKVLGPEHPDTLTSMAGLAASYAGIGRLDEALKIREEVVSVSRRALGPEHPDTLKSMANLASSYYQIGRKNEALKMREELLALDRKALGPEHPDTLKVMKSLANSLDDVGRRTEALEMREEVLAIRRKVLGPEHPDTLMSMLFVATSYRNLGRHQEALKMFEEVLALRRKVQGPEHPATFTSMDNVADSYDKLGRHEEALKMREEELALRRKVQGPEHPNTILAMNNVALSYFEVDRLDEALKLREEVLTLQRKVLGPENPFTLVAMQNLADSYLHAGRRDEAINLQEEILAISRKQPGPEHPQTLAQMQNLANSYHEAGRRDDAIKLREGALLLYRKLLPEAPSTILAMQGLAELYFEAGRRDEAITLREEALSLRRKVSGPEHPDTILALLHLAESCFKAGRQDEAIKLREEALALSRKVFVSEHPETFDAMNEWAWTLATSDSPEIRNGTNALDTAQQLVAATHRGNAEFLDSLAASYAETRQFDKAVSVEKEAIGLLQSHEEKKDYGSRLKLYQANKPCRAEANP